MVSAMADPFDARQEEYSFTNFNLVSLIVFVAGFQLSPLMIPARLDCFVYLQHDHDELEVSNEAIY